MSFTGDIFVYMDVTDIDYNDDGWVCGAYPPGLLNSRPIFVCAWLEQDGEPAGGVACRIQYTGGATTIQTSRTDPDYLGLVYVAFEYPTVASGAGTRTIDYTLTEPDGTPVSGPVSVTVHVPGAGGVGVPDYSSPPTVMTQVIDSAGPTEGYIRLDWLPGVSPDARLPRMLYDVKRGAFPDSPGLIATTDALTYLDGPLPVDNTFYYWVNAYEALFGRGTDSPMGAIYLSGGGVTREAWGMLAR